MTIVWQTDGSGLPAFIPHNRHLRHAIVRLSRGASCALAPPSLPQIPTPKSPVQPSLPSSPSRNKHRASHIAA